MTSLECDQSQHYLKLHHLGNIASHRHTHKHVKTSDRSLTEEKLHNRFQSCTENNAFYRAMSFICSVPPHKKPQTNDKHLPNTTALKFKKQKQNPRRSPSLPKINISLQKDSPYQQLYKNIQVPLNERYYGNDNVFQWEREHKPALLLVARTTIRPAVKENQSLYQIRFKNWTALL